VPGYSPALLDELTSAGEIVWTGAGALPGGDGWLVLAPAETAPLLFPPPGDITMTPAHDAVLAVLDGGGALFFRGLADRAGEFLIAAGMRATDQAVASAIWDLVWAGRLTNDTLAPLRTVLSSGRPVAPGDKETPGTGSAGPGSRSATGGPGGLGGSGGPGGAGGSSTLGWPPRAGGGLQLSRRGRGGRRPGSGRAVLPSRSGPPTVSGRWSMLVPAEPDPTRRLHALAITLLERHGIVLRGIAATERVPGGFSAIYPVLRAMEDGGQCRRGYFVEGLGAAQFALPGAVDRMRALGETLPTSDVTVSEAAGPGQPGQALAGQAGDGRAERDFGSAAGGTPGAPESDWDVRPGWDPSAKPASRGEPTVQVNWTDRSAWASEASRARSSEPPVVVLAAADPANAYGAALPWPERPEETSGGHRPGRKAGALVILCHGDLVLYVERGGKTLLSWSSDPRVLEPAAKALATAGRAGALGRLTVERADGEAVYDSPLAKALEAAGFRPTPRGLRLRA
jgi:ATP-dependent Lhr-like helicase